MDRRIRLGVLATAALITVIAVARLNRGALRYGFERNEGAQALLRAIDELNARPELERLLEHVPQSQRAGVADSVAAIRVFGVSDSVVRDHVAVLQQLFDKTPVSVCAQWGRGIADARALSYLRSLDSVAVTAWARARALMVVIGLDTTLTVPVPGEEDIAKAAELLDGALLPTERDRFWKVGADTKAADDETACWHWRAYLRAMVTLPLEQAATVYRTQTAAQVWLRRQPPNRAMERTGAPMMSAGGRVGRGAAEKELMIVNGRVFARRSLPGR